MTYRIRKAEENQADFEKLVKLLLVFASEHELSSLSGKNPNLNKGFQWIGFNLKEAVWVAEDENGEVIGSIGLHPTTTWYSDTPYLTDGWFYVLKEHRSSKIGTELLDVAKAFAKEKGMPLVVGLFNMDKIEVKVEMMKRKGFTQIGGLFLSEG